MARTSPKLSEHHHNTRDVGLSGIAILPNRMRALRPELVAELASSMKASGLLQPVVVRPSEASGFYLVAGRHRYEAAKALKWESIPACIIDAEDADRAMLAEIDENLIRNELSPAERAQHVAKRKEIYEAIHGKSKAIGARAAHAALGRGQKDANAESASASFTKDTAAKTGQSARKVQVDAKRGSGIAAAALAKLVGTSLDKGEELDALAQLPAASQNALADRAATGEKVSAKSEVKKAARRERESSLAAKQAALPEKRYGVVYADPEWRFEVYSRDTGMDRAADNHYPTSGTDAICARPVSDIAAEDCVLFLWATAPMLPDALRVMESWGFEYKSHCIWAKDRIGTGYWFRNQHELLLVGTRGNVPAPAMGTQIASLVDAPVGKHSAKPDQFYELIEAYFPNLPKIELNARRAREGWDAWGYEAPTEEAAA